MKTGDIIICHAPCGYQFTKGKEYTVLKYDPPISDNSLANFTWPAYVEVIDDEGHKAYTHANRFIPKE